VVRAGRSSEVPAAAAPSITGSVEASWPRDVRVVAICVVLVLTVALGAAGVPLSAG